MSRKGREIYMNPEKYKNEMSRQYPDRAIVEITLAQAKKKVAPEKKNHRFLKAVGGVGLSAAVLAGTFFGAGAVSGMFKEINTEEADITEEIKEVSPVISEEETEIDRIVATDDILAVTPLSNPKYTVKANTPDGKVSLDEHTTPAEMLACGVTVETDNGILGIQYLCEAFRNYKNIQGFEFIRADARTLMGANTYHYYNYDPTAPKDKYHNWYDPQARCVYWFYDHRYGQSITKHNAGIDFANMRGTQNGGLVAIIIEKATSMTTDIGILTSYDTYGVTGMDKELRKALYYEDVTKRADTGFPPFLNIIYNGQCEGKYRMNLFLERIENGAEYAGIQFTDITTTDEYDERLYSIEYCQGVYSIFTMTDGLDGKFDTQYFDGYTVADNMVVFDNGNVKYTFMLSEDVKADTEKYGDILMDNFYVGYAVGVTNDLPTNLTLHYDASYVNSLYEENVLDMIVIDEENSTEGYNAVKVKGYNSYGMGENRVTNYKLEIKSAFLGTNNKGDRYYLGDVECWSETDALHNSFVERDGEMFLMLTDEQLEKLKNFTPSIALNSDDISPERTWELSAWVCMDERE